MQRNITKVIGGMLLGAVLTVLIVVMIPSIGAPSPQNQNSDFVSVEAYSEKLAASQKICVFVGDSYGVNFATASGNGWIGWVDAFKVLFPEVTTYTSAVGGSGF